MTFSVPGYRVEQLLGSGSQGEVWLATDRSTGERVALKRMAAVAEADVQRARTEAALLSQLDHPNLIALLAFIPLEAEQILVMELAEAGSLSALLRRRDKLTPAEVVAAISPVAAALSHAHQAGILHGDVSAANILFTRAGRPKLADLGVAHLLVGRGQQLGTPAYLDPAVAAGGVAGAPSDVFSLAAVALHAITGAGPWQRPRTESASAEDVLAVAARGRIEDLAARLGPVPPAMARILTRALDPDPFSRCTAAEFALDLRASSSPTPVVLAGGRIIAPVGRHSAERRAPSAGAAQSTQGGRSTGVRPAGEPEQSFFDPTATGPRFVPADLTNIARPSVRSRIAAVTETERHRARGREWLPAVGSRCRRLGVALAGRCRSRSAARAVTLAVLVAMLVTSAVLGWPLMRHGNRADAGTAALAREQPQAAARSATAGIAERSSAGTGPSTTAEVQTAKPPVEAQPSAVELLAILAGLDARRSQAFAQRNPDLLRQVYLSAELLRSDQRQLASSVPAGCTLVGLRTSYRAPSVRSEGSDTLHLQVTATLAPARLVCHGTVRGHTAAVGPATLYLTLSRSAGDYRIVEQRIV